MTFTSDTPFVLQIAHTRCACCRRTSSTSTLFKREVTDWGTTYKPYHSHPHRWVQKEILPTRIIPICEHCCVTSGKSSSTIAREWAETLQRTRAQATVTITKAAPKRPSYPSDNSDLL